MSEVARVHRPNSRGLLIVDNYPAHPNVTKLDSITLATTRLQPCDMEITKKLKGGVQTHGSQSFA